MNQKVVFLLQYSIFNSNQEIREYFKREISLLEREEIEFDTMVVAKTDKETIDQLKDANVVLCWGNPILNDNIISNLPDLKVILEYGVGTNSVDLDSATKNNVLVYNLPDCSKKELAYHALSMILANLRNITRYDKKMREGIWDKGGGPKPRRLENLVVGLYGLGNSGTELAKILVNGFGTRVIANDPYAHKDFADSIGVSLVDFHELTKQSDIISIHAPLTEETKHKFNRRVFQDMKAESMIINVSRGPIININDLCEALKMREIMYCGLDVFEEEPMPAGHELFNFDNVIVTPHSAYFGAESELQMNQDASMLLEEFVVNNRVIGKYVVNRDMIINADIEVL